MNAFVGAMKTKCDLGEQESNFRTLLSQNFVYSGKTPNETPLKLEDAGMVTFWKGLQVNPVDYKDFCTALIEALNVAGLTFKSVSPPPVPRLMMSIPAVSAVPTMPAVPAMPAVSAVPVAQFPAAAPVSSGKKFTNGYQAYLHFRTEVLKREQPALTGPQRSAQATQEWKVATAELKAQYKAYVNTPCKGHVTGLNNFNRQYILTHTTTVGGGNQKMADAGVAWKALDPASRLKWNEMTKKCTFAKKTLIPVETLQLYGINPLTLV
jgi:hypothetical protein